MILRRLALFAALAYVVTSCGLDVVGREPVGPKTCVFDDRDSHFDEPPCVFAP